MPNDDVPPPVREMAGRLAEPKPMRRGSLSVRYLKCNKPGCPCAEDRKARHGPYASVVRTISGRTRSRHVPAGQAGLLQQQIEAGQRFRQDVEAYWEVCEQWADAELDSAAASSCQVAQKGASKRRSKLRSSPKSKRS